MRKLALLFLSAIFCLTFATKAQDTTPGAVSPEGSPFSMDVTLNSDIFFGFYPFFAGSYALSDNSAFTFYGILWSGGTGAAWGNWTEAGIGYNFSPMDGLDINPQIGLLNGSLTSGLGRPRLAEGIVPNLTVGLDLDHLEGELYGGYYMGFKPGHGAPATLNYLHYWANAGYKFGGGFLSAGLHFEHLRLAGSSDFDAWGLDGGVTYFAVAGPYVQFADPNGGAFARFTGALDVRGRDAINENVDWTGHDARTFFKLTAGYSF